MTSEQWLATVNKLKGKTAAGKVAWAADGSGHACRATVGEDHAVLFEYEALHVGQEIHPRSGSLRLTLLGPGEQRLAVLSEEAMEELAGDAGVLALRSLFDEIVAKPRRNALSSFQSALDDL